jgi:hypothetical protein
VWAEQRPSERTNDSDTVRWAGWRDREHLRDSLGVRIKTVGEDEGIGDGLVCTEFRCSVSIQDVLYTFSLELY